MGWCSHFGKKCDSFVMDSGATSVTFQSANQPTTPASTTSVTISGKACDAVKSEYLSSGSGVLDNLAACSRSCQNSAQCKSITFYSSSKWCSHFSKTCDSFVTGSGTTSVTFQS